jgi:predicted nucleic acid-binding protein
MGSLTIPAGAEVYLDTVTIIYSIETHPKYWPVLKPLWQAAAVGDVKLCSSELALLETLVGPLKHGDHVLVDAYERLFRSTDFRTLPLTQHVLRRAAKLRATVAALRTPDALHAATAMLENCAIFLTNDVGFRRITGLPVLILDEV